MIDSLLVGYDYTPDTDKAILIVGKKRPNESVEIVNAFEGDEAKELYRRLVIKREIK